MPEVSDEATQQIESEAEDAFRRIAVLPELQFFDNRLPLTDDEGPGKSQREQGQQSA